MEVINGITYTATRTETGHEILTAPNGRVKAHCTFCEKVKDAKVVGAAYNTFHQPFMFPVNMCKACSKRSGFETGPALA